MPVYTQGRRRRAHTAKLTNAPAGATEKEEIKNTFPKLVGTEES